MKTVKIMGTGFFMVLVLFVALGFRNEAQDTRLDALEGRQEELMDHIVDNFEGDQNDWVDMDAHWQVKTHADQYVRDSVNSVHEIRLDSLAAENRNQTEAIKQLQKEKRILRGGR